MNISKTPLFLRACACVFALAAIIATAPLATVPVRADETSTAAAPKQPKAKGKAKAKAAPIRDQDRVAEVSDTPYPSSAKPDSVILTWTGDPSTTQTIRWRTNTTVATGTLAFARLGADANAATLDLASAKKFPATTQTLATPNVTNDPSINLHTVTLTGLEPATRYAYSVGDGSADGWTPPETFSTAPAPAKPQPFSFIYIGDAQAGGAKWGSLMHGALQKRPDAAFVLMAGDIVDRGLDRQTFDDLFHNAKGIFDTRPVVPTAGNHDYHGGTPRLYLNEFALCANGPKNIGPGLAYSFEYSDALFVVLDANRDIAAQAPWLEKQLRDTKATWKFVLYHQPAYDSRAGRSNPEVIRYWVPLFDKYHVDLALQGHDHAYMRTYPMRASQRVATPADGTIYMITFSCPKHYELEPHDYAEVAFPDVPTWQIIDISPETRTLCFRAYDADGKLRDEFSITK